MISPPHIRDITTSMFSQWKINQTGCPLNPPIQPQQGYLADVIPKSATCPETADKDKQPDILIKELETVSCLILEDHGNANHFGTHATLGYISPSFKGNHDGLPNTLTRDQHLELLIARNKITPHMRIEIKNVSTDLRDVRGVADVFIFYQLAGLGHEIVREAIAVVRWQRDNERWMCIGVTTMRGTCGYAMG